MIYDVQRNGISDDRSSALGCMRMVKVTMTSQYGQNLVLKLAKVYPEQDAQYKIVDGE